MSANLYETDHAAWLERQTALLKGGRLAELDIEYLAEELEWAMGKERREIYKRLRILMGHIVEMAIPARAALRVLGGYDQGATKRFGQVAQG